MNLSVRGKFFNVRCDVLKKSPYFDKLIEWDGESEMEIDNDPDEFEQFLKFLEGKEDHPGVLGDFYMVGSGKPSISNEKNVVENAMKPYDIQKPNHSYDAIYMYCYGSTTLFMKHP